MIKVNFEGKTLFIDGQAQHTNALLDGRYTNYMDAKEGEEYDFEMSEKALDEQGNEYIAYYMLRDIKGSEWNSENFDWEIYRIEEV